MKQVFDFNTDNKLRISYWGRSVSRFTSKPPETAIGEKYYAIFPKILVDSKDALSLVLMSKKTLNLKAYQFNCLYGQNLADITIIPKKSSNGAVTAVNVRITPYSSCAEAEELYQSQKLIDIGKTASVLAHGVRSPLNAIKGAVVYLRGKYSKEQTLIEFTKIMEEEIERLDRFISKFLSSSVSEEKPEYVSINLLLKKINIFTALQTQTSNINTFYEYGRIPKIYIDPFQLEHAILNVLNNAIEAMPAGGDLTLKTYTEKLSGKSFVVIEITDTGKGISMKPKRLKKRTSEGSGRGFGLFITREIVQYFGGHLEIRSKKNFGTSVKLCLPAQKNPKG